MMDELQLFRGQDYKINEHVIVRHPTLNEICDYGEEKYYTMVSGLCSTPSDCKVQLLDTFGLDYEEISEFDLFCMMCRSYPLEDTTIILGDLNFQQFDIAQNTKTNELILYNQKKGFSIDRTIYLLLVQYLRRIHGFERRVDKAGNEHTKKYLLDRERQHLQRRRNIKYQSTLVPFISAMVNCEQFKYDHAAVWNLPIYVFLDSVQRIQKLKNYNQIMQGVYAGTVDLKTLSSDSVNWMGSLSVS